MMKTNEEGMTKVELGDEVDIKEVGDLFNDLARMGLVGQIALSADISMFQFIKDMFKLRDQVFIKHAMDVMNAEG